MRRIIAFLVLVILLASMPALAQNKGRGGGSGTLTVKEEDGSPSVAAGTIKFSNGTVTDNGDGSASVSVTGGGAPTGATYIMQTPDAGTSAEQALSLLATGCLGSTTTTGVVASRTITGTANQISVANGDCSGAPTISIPTNPTLPGTTTGTFSGNLTGAVTGNASTATALVADPADCSANNFANAINASGTLTCGQPSISAGVSGLGTNVATFLGTPSSANLASALTNETGSGAAVFATGPTLDAPVITTKFNVPRGTAFPGTPSAGDTIVITDDSAAGACDSAAGSAVTLCYYTGSAWAKLGDGTGAGGSLTSADIDTSAELRTILTDETGTGGAVFATSPTIDAPTITGGATFSGAASGVVDINGVTSGKLRLTAADATAQTVTVTTAAQTVGAATLTIPNRAGTNGTFAFTDGNVATATALAADPADCSANNFATSINASGTLTCGQPSISAGVSGLGTGVATFLGTPSSANLASALTNETGSGAAVFGTAPTIDAPVLTSKVNLPRVTAFPGTPSAGDTVIVTDDSTAGACDSAAGSATSLCQYSGSAWVKLGDGTSAGGALSSTDIDTSAEIAAIVGDETGSGALVFGTSPTLTTPTIGVATATSINKMAITAPATSSTLAVANGKTLTASNTLTLAGTDSTTITFQATDTYVGRATTDTLTNKTLDVEGTGNVFTTVRRLFFPAAGCNNATAGSVWDLPTTNPAVAACVTGTNTQKGVLDFADGSNLSAQTTYMLPTTWTGTIDARIKWVTSATTGDVVWQLSTICVADAETDDPAFNTASTVTDTAKGTTLQTNDAAITTVIVTGCAAGELMHLKIQRDSAHASDTLAATARLIGVELAVREAL